MGLLRVLLAFCVIAGHTQSTVFDYVGPSWSTRATQVFFIISGFYMSMILDGPYKERARKLFYLSRAARIYPAYWLSLVLCVLAVLHTHGAAFFDPALSLPWYQELYLAFTNVFIFGQDLAYLFCLHNAATGECYSTPLTILNGPAWSIAPELLFYLMAPWVATSLRRSLILIGIGAAYMAYVPMIKLDAVRAVIGNSPNLHDATFTYYLFPATFLMFGTGVVSYHLFYKRLVLGRDRDRGNADYWVFCALACLLTIICPDAASGSWLEQLTFLVALPCLFAMTRDNKVDRFIGDLSYPIYIVHYPLMVSMENYHFSGVISFGSAVALSSIAVGCVVYFLIDSPVDRWRHGLVRSAPNVSPHAGPWKAVADES